MQTKEEHNAQYRERYNQRKAQGICTKCGKEKAVAGKTLCKSCRDKRNRRHNERYHERKTLNICARCGKPKSDDGHVFCLDCLEHNRELHSQEKYREYNKRYSKEQYEWRKANGICVQCGKEKAWHNNTCCPTCMEYNIIRSAERRNNMTEEQRQEYLQNKKIYGRELRAYRKENGLCIDCGKPKTIGNYCTECNVKRVKKQKEYSLQRSIANDGKVNKRQFKIQNGLCLRCGDPIEGNHGTWCDACANKQAEVFRLHKSAEWVRKNELLFMTTAKRKFVYGT